MAEHDVLPVAFSFFIDGQEILIHLQDVPGDLPDQVQGAVADPEVIHGGVDPGIMQGAGDAFQVTEFHVRNGFCQFDLDEFVGNMMLIDDRQDAVCQVHVDQVAAGKVYGYTDDLAPFIQPAAQIPANLIQHVEIQLADVHGLLQVGYIIRGHDQGSVAAPAAQGLGTGNAVIPQVDLWLVEDLEFMVFQSYGELGTDLHEPVLFLHHLFTGIDDIPGISAPGSIVGAGEAVQDIFAVAVVIVFGNKKDPGT